MRILNVAEKNSVAREMFRQLSENRGTHSSNGGQFVGEFPFQVQGMSCDMVVTAVRGHLMEMDFEPEFRSWNTVDPSALFSCPIKHSVAHTGLAQSLRALSRQADWLILWLDCDREGEGIAFEVLDVCMKANRNLRISRARFSALTRQDLMHAINTLGPPNRSLAEAVLARTEIDLRVGAAFTRFLTLRYQSRLGFGGSSTSDRRLVSFGGCQTVTLGFVVARYLQRERFTPELFWSLKLTCRIPPSPATPTTSPSQVTFEWNRIRLFDKPSVVALQYFCSQPVAVVTESSQQPKSKWRPLPLNTLEMTKIASTHLRMASHHCMQLAESLYARGLVSYPRTETDTFEQTGLSDLRALVRTQTASHEWGEFARSLTESRFTNPRNGNRNDQAHPPIQPLKSAQRSEFDSPEEWKVFELIARHFLACCAPDAAGVASSVEVALGTERFHTSGLVVHHLNWLEVYPYAKWVSSTTLPPECRVGDTFPIHSIALTEGRTEPPHALTESEILAMMDKEGIGTDATMHEHIKTIQLRGYCFMDTARQFIPTSLGIALVLGLGAYEALGIHLAKPTLRASMERDMGLIGRGELTRPEFIAKYTRMMKEIFVAISDSPFALDSQINNSGGDTGGGGGGGASLGDVGARGNRGTTTVQGRRGRGGRASGGTTTRRRQPAAAARAGVSRPTRARAPRTAAARAPRTAAVRRRT